MRLIILSLLAVAFLTPPAFAETKKAYIEAPNPCCRIEKVEGEKIYLKSTDNSCIQVISKIPVDLSPEVKHVYIFVDGKFWKEHDITEFNLDSIRDYLKSTEEYGKNIKVPENKHKEQGEKEAEAAVRYFNSEEYQKKLQAENERLKETVFKKPLEEYYVDSSKGSSKIPGELSSTERIYIFVSSSMPLETLRNYAMAMNKLQSPNISMVMRGFVGGAKYIRPTLNFISGVIFKDRSCDISNRQCETYSAGFQIDPFLFRRYEITKVPAIVYVKSVDVVDMSISEGLTDNAKASDYYVIYGDASLEYILDVIYKETKSKSIEALLTALRKGFY